MSSIVTRLRVKDEDFLVAAMIERCPKTMMIRELFQNALEAAAMAPEGQRQVVFSALPVDGVPKLALWNTGQGLTGQELYQMCDIAASIRKETGLDRNFGMGAKVASLPSNQAGMRYRSAHQGSVQEVMIGKYEGAYGRLLRPGPDGTPTEVITVTEEAAAEGRDTQGEWTEVVLMGNRPEQNTVTDPYDGNPRSGALWLVETLRNRFFRLPAGTDVTLRTGVAQLKEDRRLYSLFSALSALPNYEAVTTPEGIVIHYAFNPAMATTKVPGVVQAWELGHGMAGLVYKNEIYSPLKHATWLREAPSFGVSFLARAISIFVELPDDYLVVPEAYREFLRYQTACQKQVRVHDFSALVVRHQPAWLKQLLSEAVPKADYIDNVMAEISSMLEEMGIAYRRPGQAPTLFRPPALQAAAEPAAPATTDQPAEPPPFRAEKPPSIILLRDPADIADRSLTHRAAAYYAETHQLHVNLQYPVIEETAQALAATAPPDLDIEAVQAAARLTAERAMVSRVARTLVYSLGKRGRPREWNEIQLRFVFSPEALTLAADDTHTGRQEAESVFAEALKTIPKAAPAEESLEAVAEA